MPNYERIRPVFLPIRPPVRGMDISKPPQTIELLSSPELSNVHFVGGQLQTRSGFAAKYQGMPEPIFNMWTFYDADGTYEALLSFGLSGVWQFHTDAIFKPTLLYDTLGALAPLTTLAASAYYSIAVGSGSYTPHTINAAAIYPTSGYENILAFTNGFDGVFVIIPASDGDPLVGELIDDAATNGFSGAVAVSFFANRLVVFGTTNNPSEVTFSVAGAFEDFAGVGSGTAVLADDADRIQAALLMREFLVVYKERSLYIGRATGRSDLPIVFEKGPGGNIGTVAPMSVVGTADEHFFLGSDNVYKFSPEGIAPIGDPIRDELFGRVGSRGIDPQYASRSFGALVREFNEYWLFTASGNVPTVTNKVTDGDMTIVLFTADTTLGDPTITNVPAEVFTLLRRETAIRDMYDILIPAGTTIDSYDSGAQTITMSANALATGTSTLQANATHGWFSVDVTTQQGGNIGGVFQRLTRTPPASATFATTTNYPAIVTAVGDTVSILLWLRVPETTDIVISVYEKPATIEHSRTLTLEASTNFQPVMYSFVSDGICANMAISIGIQTQGSYVDIDAVQLVNMSLIDERFWYRDANGYVAPGLITEPDSNEVTLIPYITGAIGPWSCDTAWIYNYRTQAWSVWKLYANCTTTDTVQATTITIADLVGSIDQQFWRFDTQEMVTLSPSNLLGASDGQVFETAQKYRYDRQGFLDQPVLSYWQSKDFDLDQPNQDKTVSRVTIFHERSHPPTNLQIGISTDSGNAWNRQTVVTRTGFTETYADFFITGTQARFEVRAESPGFYITGFSLKLIPRGESNAY